MRPSEKEGVEYYFIDAQKFREMVEKGDFVENAEFAGNFYATSLSELERIQKLGKVPLLDIEVRGVEQIKEKKMDATFVLIAPPSIEELIKRLLKRGDTSEESIMKRMERAKKDLSFQDQPGFFDLVIVNDDVGKAYERFKKGVIDHFKVSIHKEI